MAPILFGAFCILQGMTKQFGFGKNEKLKSRKQIEELFAKGKSFAVFPLRVIYQIIPTSGEPMLQVGVTAGSKHFKKAVDRNRIKRLLRETYRLQKAGLSDVVRQKRMNVFIFFMYLDKTIPPFNVIKESMNNCLNRLEQKLSDIDEYIV